MLSVAKDAGLSGPLRYSVEDVAPKDWVTEVQGNQSGIFYDPVGKGG